MRTFLLYVENLQEAIAEIKKHKGHVTQICTQHVIVCNVPEDFDIVSLQESSTALPKTIDSTSKLFFDAWHTDFPQEDLPIQTWNEIGLTPTVKTAPEDKIDPAHTSSYMTGYIAVGLVIVSGGQSQLIFSKDETTFIINKVMSGLQAMASFEPLAKITFIYQINLLSVDVLPSAASCPDYETCESIWRNPALQLLGCTPDWAGIKQHNKKLINTLKTDWAFTAFFTKYPLYHFAYAGDGRICIEYNNRFNDGYMDSIFAHEVGHIFGAADEYSDSKSKCDCEVSGFFYIPNLNCVECSSDFPKVSCLMDNNYLGNICAWSRGQVGWPFHIPMHGASRRPPSITVFKDKLYVAIVANNDSYELLLGSSSDGINWEYKNMNAASKEAPSLAVFKDKLHVAFVANNNTNTLLTGSSADGINWSYSSMDRSSKASPSLTAFNDKLYIAFVDNNKTNALLSGSSSDGKSWAYINMEGASRTAPSLTVFKDKLHVAFVANNDSYELLMGTSPDGKKWSYDTMGGSSKAAPSLAVLNDKMYIAFVANEIVNHLLIGFSDDGKNWTFGPMSTTAQGSPSIVGMIVPPVNESEKERHRLYVSFVEDNVGNQLLIWRAQSVLFE